jgi:hypothetical protein
LGCLKLNSINLNSQQKQKFYFAYEQLKPIIAQPLPKVISIDGRYGVGKTTLGRFLSWRFDITLVETDIHLRWDIDQLTYKLDEIQECVFDQLNAKKHVLMEGVSTLKLIGDLAINDHFHIHVTCDRAEEVRSNLNNLQNADRELVNFLDLYEECYCPKENADLRVELPYWNRLDSKTDRLQDKRLSFEIPYKIAD